MVCGAMVEAIATIAPSPAPASTPFSPNITASTSGSKPTTTMTSSLAAATAFGELTGCMPAAAAAFSAGSATSKPVDREAALHQMAADRQAHLAEPDQAHAADVLSCSRRPPRVMRA